MSTLSDKIHINQFTKEDWLKAKYVKKFIKELKEAFNCVNTEDEEIIDKLAGEKLL